MADILKAVRDSAIRILRDRDGNADIYSEEILRSDGSYSPDNSRGNRWYFVEAVPTAFSTINRFQTEFSVTVSIDCHEPEESVREYGRLAMELDGILRPVFLLVLDDERRYVTVPKVNASISGGLLHVTFPLVFLVSKEESEASCMESIVFRTEKG